MRADRTTQPLTRIFVAIAGLVLLAACTGAPTVSRDTASDCQPLTGTTPGELVPMARRSLARGCIDDAVAALRRADALKPGDAEILRVLGEALLTSDRVDEAIAALERSRALGSFNFSWDELLGFAYLRKGDVTTAEGIFRHTLARVREAQLASVALGWIHGQQDRPTDSGTRLTPLPKGRFPSYQAWLAYQHGYREDVDGGLRQFAALERHDGGDAMFHFLWAGLHVPRTRADAEQACQRYARAEQLDPTCPSAAAACGQDLAIVGQFERSTAEFARTYRLAPDHPAIMFMHAGALNLEGKRQEAAAKLADAERIAPRDARFPEALAVLLRKLGDTTGALAAESRAKALRAK